MDQTMSDTKLTSSSTPQNSFEPMLMESIHQFLTKYQQGANDFSSFTSIFSRLIQNLPDPPLEVVWFFSAITAHTSKCNVQDNSKQVSAAKNLFQLLVSCSSSCNAIKKVAILAPVIYQLCHLAFDRRELKREAESLLEGIVCYISLCCGIEHVEDDAVTVLESCSLPLIRMWVVDKIEDNCDNWLNLSVFYPYVSSEVRSRIGSGCSIGFLAGVVMCETFLLRLCLKFESAISTTELKKHITDCAVEMITGFRSYYFLDFIFKMLLEPLLPEYLLLGSTDEVLLREALYDAVVTADYSFLNFGGGIQLTGEHVKNLAITWLLVTDSAICSVRKSIDQTKIITYLHAFSVSCIHSHFKIWVTNQAAVIKEASMPKSSTPRDLIKRLLMIENQGVKVFDSDVSRTYAKTATLKSREQHELPVLKLNGKYLSENLCSSYHKRKFEDRIDFDLEMADCVDNTSSAAEKRKEVENIEGEKRVKLIKYTLCKNSVRDNCLHLTNGDGLSSGSEVDNPISDEDMEDME